MPQPTKRLRSNPDLKYSIGRKRKLCFRGNQYKQAPSTDRVINARQRSAAESNNPRLKAASRRKILPLSDEQSQAGSAQFRLLDVTTEGYHSGLWAWFIKEDSMATGTSISIFQSEKLWKKALGPALDWPLWTCSLACEKPRPESPLLHSLGSVKRSSLSLRSTRFFRRARLTYRSIRRRDTTRINSALYQRNCATHGKIFLYKIYAILYCIHTIDHLLSPKLEF
ncbi:unnamed protein product [Trichogramma brassicae]|uniref:Uncharacterized protein n=1 Tax=Trichogramma brassicae TaxID=86971 RepID=A0A6H5I875_9HYME|nr:unnamed protein product [Trichogramma brassicae]